VTGRPGTGRDRLSPWIDAMRHRAELLDPPRDHAAAALVEVLEAIAGGEWDRVAERLADDVVVRVSGFVPGGDWRWQGTAAHDVLERAMAHPSAPLTSGRVDVDRFFAAVTEVGFDGDLSWLVPGTASAPDGDVDLVTRRIAVFATFDGSVAAVLRSVDVYGDVHEVVAVSDRPPR
jgi:hypothetical protein